MIKRYPYLLNEAKLKLDKQQILAICRIKSSKILLHVITNRSDGMYYKQPTIYPYSLCFSQIYVILYNTRGIKTCRKKIHL